MAHDPKNPAPGELAIDASEVAAFVSDHPPGATVGLRHEQDGYADVEREIVANQAADGQRAGVTEKDVADLTEHTTQIAAIDKFLAPSRRLVEMLEESRAIIDDDRQRIISAIASSVDRHAKRPGNADLLGQYEKTCEYRSAIAAKAVRTRKQKAAKKDA